MDGGLTDDIRNVERRAAARATRSPSGIGAAIVERRTGGWVRCRISDGRMFGWVEVEDPTVAAETRLVTDLERFALSLPDEDRLGRLEKSAPLAYPFG
ncbi:MAG TPA: hypothetical protein VN238_20175 [Solirubrobacteraceae bacterium]|nr:hypothetical protein [Solirubrobacteraceae bacterium]